MRRLARAVVGLGAAAAMTGCPPASWADGSGATGRVAAGQTVSSDTSDDEDDWEPSCGETGGGGDEVWLFEPAATGIYELRVEARFDAVLALYSGHRGSELACNDDLEGTAISRLRLRLEGGHRYAVVVDGYRGDSGPYELSVRAVELEDVDAEGRVRHTGPGQP